MHADKQNVALTEPNAIAALVDHNAIADMVAKVDEAKERETAAEIARPTTSLIDDLLSESAPDGADADGRHATFTLSTGRELKMRLVTDADGLERITRLSRQLANLKKDNAPASIRPYLPLSEKTARGIAFVSSLVVEPKLSQADCARLAKERGGYFLEIVGEVLSRLFTAKTEEDESLIEDEGEG